ncbi:hypothetical protein AB6735_18690 [Mucilaginibacter sp. RCC_168]|uniref:hypothetical protein n=1 Tax=Mucilaginibacter sp. RCC_168 TaxID=3239221 RepID=UPI003525F02C
MAFLEKSDLRSKIREYQLNSITDNDDTIVEMAIEAGIEEASSLLTRNDKKEWDDGRPHYDVEAIFNASGTDRNGLMLANTKSIVMWHLIDLCNTGLDYEKAESRYDRAVEYLEKLAAGDGANSRTLPRITAEPPIDDQPFAMGSRRKFCHDN